jgi:glycerophosphoryl diester phosphodiesterase
MMIATLTLILAGAADVAVSPKACAHRGDLKCFPENTVPAFESAVTKGAHQIEFDLYLSKDGRLIVIHDETVDRTTDGKGKVTDLTFDELRALDAGGWFAPEFAGTRIPTFRETLEAIPPRVLCNVHLKNAPGVAEAATRVIVDMKRLEQCFLACKLEQIEAARKIESKTKFCNMSRQFGDRDAYVQSTIDAKGEFIQLCKELDGLKDAVDKCHANGVAANFFHGTEPEMIRGLADAGIDYILTNDLDTCLQILKEEYGTEPLKGKE